MGWNVRGGPLTRDRALGLCGHAHSDTKSTYVIHTNSGANSQITVIPSDYSGQLTYLLRYSSNIPMESMSSTAPHHTSLLLRQALTLQMSPTAAAGASIVFENHNLLNLPTEVPESPPKTSHRLGGRPVGRRKSASETRPAPPDSGHSSRGSLRRAANGQLNLPDFAKGLLDRGEALGINKTFINAVSEIKVRLARLFDTAADHIYTCREIYPILRQTLCVRHSHMRRHTRRIRSSMNVRLKNAHRGSHGRVLR